MLELFPGAKLKLEKLCVITLSERTENDMILWSMAVEEERERLLEHVSVCYVCISLVPRPFEGKRKGLVHTVCACTKFTEKLWFNFHECA